MNEIRSILDRTSQKLKQLKLKDYSLLNRIDPDNNVPLFLEILNFIWVKADVGFKNKIEKTFQPLLPLSDKKFIQMIFIIFVSFIE